MFGLGKRMVFLVALLVAAAFIVTGCGGGEVAPVGDEDAEKMKVGFVYIGSPGDAGWTYAHDQGRKYLEENLPYVITETVENVSDADAERVLTQLAERGNRVIFATSFGFMDPVINVAAKYPDVIFLHCSGYKTADNATNYFGRIYQPRYLSGIVAGMTTESNLIGYVAAYPIPEVIRGINAFTLGVRAVNPEAKVRVVWTHTWYDPAKEKEAAKVLLDAGADVIAQHQDTPGPQQAAQERGVFSIGYNSDMSAMAPEAVLTSVVWNWGPYYVRAVEAVKNGTWDNTPYWGSMADGIVDLAPFGPMVSEEIKGKVAKEKERILSGDWDVFHGPIYAQDGELKVAAGEALTDAEMLEMSWFVQGVEGSIPN